MDEQASWKGQSFTLLVFGGIVFLCSIFFVLGMLVGRGQGERAAEAASLKKAIKAAEAEVKAAEFDAPSPEPKSSVSSYETITTGKASNSEQPASKTRLAEEEKPASSAAAPPAKQAPKAAAAASPAPAKAVPEKTASPTPVKMIYLQVAAMEKSAAAKKQVEELRKAGFPAVVVGGDGPKALFKVQVGPFATAADAETSRQKLKSLGYDPIRK